MKNSVIIKSNKYGIVVILDNELPYDELLKDIGDKFRESSRFFKNATMAITFEGRRLSDTQQRDILDIISENTSLNVICVDQDEIREQYFKKTLDERLNELSSNEGQFYKGTLRSGQVLESETSIIILGDVNPGAKVISKGNVVVLGALKGTVYAGGAGNSASFVVALSMDPMQIRIGDVMARSADKPVKNLKQEPKIAFVEDENIYIESITKDVINDMRF